MVRQVRLFDQPEPDDSNSTDSHTRTALGPPLGTLHITFDDPDAAGDARQRPSGWGGKIRGSDYLVWGMNHRRVTIEFDNGERASAVIRATGDLIGLGDRPATLAS